VENMVISSEFWSGKRVLITGHTGFKGGWLSLWLSSLGADILGFSNEVKDEYLFYKKVFNHSFVGQEVMGDIRDFDAVFRVIDRFCPDVIFHLAAQPLVRASYSDPVDTFNSNILGVVNLLEAVRRLERKSTVINVTTDKVYQNNEWIWSYRENEPLGGKDPYSASKACSELISFSYAKSFFEPLQIPIAMARAGNVIGGGDMSKDRLVPDCLRAYASKKPITIRNPEATRPWQHVLDPVGGYILLAQKLHCGEIMQYGEAWNFGPIDDPVSVRTIVEILSGITGCTSIQFEPQDHFPEAVSLMLDSSKARKILKWSPKLDVENALKFTFEWFRASEGNSNMRDFSLHQITKYTSLL